MQHISQGVKGPMINISWDGLAEGFAQERDFCRGYSPLYETIFSYAAVIASKRSAGQALGVAEQAFIDLLEREWADRKLETSVGAALLFAAAIHAAVLSGDPEAAEVRLFYETAGGKYDPKHDRVAFLMALDGLLQKPGTTLPKFLRSGHVQTNEISRSVAWLIPALVMNGWQRDLPITLVDLGCSAGVNLVADQLSWRWTNQDGDRTLNLGNGGDALVKQHLNFGIDSTVPGFMPEGEQPKPNIVKRLGFDARLPNLEDPDDLMELFASIWGDQADRLQRCKAALEEVKKVQPERRTANIVEVSGSLHTQIPDATKLVVVFNSAVTMYMIDEDYSTLHDNITATFLKLPKGTRGLWVELEPPRKDDPESPDMRFPLKLHMLRESDLRMYYLAFTESHPRNVVLLPGWNILTS